MEVFPEAVTENREDGLLSVDYTALVAPMIESIKELDRKLDEQIRKNEQLLEELELLRSLVEKAAD